ncbi:host specificity protein J [Aquitalea pelogenes]|uniref:host specificity protein J n=1 Tax=Aquitalea pelogenes TaxID=1293573 RepID=UPI0035AD9216
MQRIQGAGGGGGQPSSRRPVEAPDSLQSVATARLMLLVALGETGGPVNGLKSIYLDGTPIENADGSRNFERVQAEWRTGTPTQLPFSGFSEVETETAVGVEIKAGAGLVRHIDNLEANAVRVTVSVSGLFQVDANSNDTNPARVEMAVDLKPADGIWAEQKQIVIQGKCRGKYQRAVRVPLAGKGPWQLRVRRLTPDSITQNLVNATGWDSFTTIQELQLRYPNYAMLALAFDARQFNRLPEITSDWQLAILQVPSNYHPVTGVYDGAWDGRFKPAHSSNPAWWLYTIGTDPRYNLNLPAEGAWKWDLYRIAQWCDQLVSDGQGGQRRRFEMHHYQTDSADGWKVLQDIASVFCGRVIPYAGGVRVMADMPEATPAKQFVPANVEEGRFTYSSTALDERYTVASVSFVDPDDGWKRGTEYVEHPAGLSRYGYQPAKVVAMGCTSRAQAQQYGRYLLETAQNETETVSFVAGLYGSDLLLGETFTIADPVVAGRRMGGRLLAVDGRAVTLDAPVLLEPGVRYSLECPLPDGTLARRAVGNAAGQTDQLNLVAAFPTTPLTGTTWTLLASNLQPTLWRCVSHREREPGVYEISGIQHFAEKWQAIEQGLYLSPSPVSQQPDALQLPPVGSVSLRETVYTTGDQRRALRLEVDWAALSHPYLRGYVVACRQEGGDWVEQAEQSANHAELEGLAIGSWQVRVVAVSLTGLRSVPVLASIKVKGPSAKPPTPQLSASGGAMLVELGWRFPPGVPDLATVELRYSTRSDDPNPPLLAQLAWPTNSFTHLGVGLGVKYWYWLRVQDSWGNWSGSARASAASIKDPAPLLEQLEGSITGAALADSLRQPIESIGPAAKAVAALTQRVDSVSNDVSASVRKVEQVQSTLSGQTAIVQDLSHAVDGVLAEKTIKVTAGGKVAGIGLRADKNGTALDVLADRFAVSLPDGSGSKQVFTVGQINGQPAVGIAGAVITDGSLVGKRVLASESVEAAQINTRGLTIKDAAGNVVVDMNGMGAAFIKGQLSAGQIDSRGLVVRDQNGKVILDSGGLDGSFIKDLTVGTLKITDGGISWLQSNSGSRAISFHTPFPASVYLAFTGDNFNYMTDKSSHLASSLLLDGAARWSCTNWQPAIGSVCLYVTSGWHTFSWRGGVRDASENRFYILGVMR